MKKLMMMTVSVVFGIVVLLVLIMIRPAIAQGPWFYLILDDTVRRRVQCLDAQRADMHSRAARIQIWECGREGEINQLWRFVDGRLQNGAGLYLDVHSPEVYSDGGRVQLWSRANWINQQWNMDSMGRLVNGGGKCLDAPSRGSGGNVHMWRCHDGANQVWRRHEIPTLTDAQRRAFLEYYSPIIMKRTDENDHEHYGYDWITNFDFDRDGDYSTNRTHWKHVDYYVKSSGDPSSYEGPHDFASWRIRPTLYTALIEFQENGRKNLVLIYHVYHAEQHHKLKAGVNLRPRKRDIHDWERIEIRVSGIDSCGIYSGRPGSGERIEFVVLTNHHDHFAKSGDDPGLHFMDTDTGRHVLVWQAQWTGERRKNRLAELHYVTESLETIRGRRQGHTKINGEGDDKKNVNYIFVCEGSSSAVEQWEASPIDWTSAGNLAAKKKGRANWSAIPKITYELQDIADILPSHWEGGGYDTHWFGNSIDIFLDDPILSESGDIEVPVGQQTFFTRSKDVHEGDGKGDRDGYPNKSWLWGVYKYGGYKQFRDQAFNSGFRTQANLDEDSRDSYWRQHDYFAHDGSGEKNGRWLPYGWQVSGFDGRWVQLFPDDR